MKTQTLKNRFGTVSIEDGGLYEIDHGQGGVRRFKVGFDGNQPLVAPVSATTGETYPWTTANYLNNARLDTARRIG